MNYSSHNRIYMFLEYLIPNRISDFSIVFHESTFKKSKQTEPKYIFQSMCFLGIIYPIKVFTRDLSRKIPLKYLRTHLLPNLKITS